MKNSYLITHIVSHLHSFARIYGKNQKLVETFSGAADFSDTHFFEQLTGQPLLRNYDAVSQLPLIFTVNDTLVYAWIPLGEHLCLLGPTRLAEKVDFLYRLQFPESSVDSQRPLRIWANQIPCCSVGLFARDILLLYRMEDPDRDNLPPIGTRQLIAANCTYQQLTNDTIREFYKTVFTNMENGNAHNPYNHEYREVACIRRGDVEGLRRVQEEVFPGRYGKLSEDPVRQQINIGIVAITLASRAAIEGGLHYEVSFSLSDAFIQQMDACTDPVAIDILYHNAMIQYAQLVHDLLVKKEGDTPALENRHISHCKDYVFAHLHEKLTVQQIANAIGLDANYLSALFRKSEKVSLKQFIMHEKINLAKSLLAYSSRSYAQIASSLGFSSQSHMGREFKRITGMTPHAYRLEHSEDDFVNKSMTVPAEE